MEIKVGDSPFMGVSVNTTAKVKKSHSTSLAFPTLKDLDRPSKRAKMSGPVGTSKQVVWKHTILDQMEARTWVVDTKKWEAYKSKLVKLDPKFEVPDEPRLAHHVKHSHCGSWIIMTIPYNVG
jgi:hypothetical protein